jgi:3-mercaptopyruvate sulfurtransferase SseA
MSLKPAEDLKRLYSKLDPSKETIVYCQSGARASETAGVLQQLGFTNVKVYDSSWLGYGNTRDGLGHAAGGAGSRGTPHARSARALLPASGAITAW